MKKRWLAVGYLSVAHRARTPRLTEEQIIGILKENQAGIKVRELVRRYGVCEQTIYRWKSEYGGMDLSEARRLKALEEENRQLKRLVSPKYTKSIKMFISVKVGLLLKQAQPVAEHPVLGGPVLRFYVVTTEQELLHRW